MCNVFLKLKNPIKNFKWGSKTLIPKLFNISNENKVVIAEIWMGAHVNGCSIIQYKDSEIFLSDFIEKKKFEVLSQDTAINYGMLPYLFKILSADKALSIQVHPNKKNAENGFVKENSLGIEIFDFKRNYPDRNHKPELIYALTEFKVMCGFRSVQEIENIFSDLLEKTQIPKVKVLFDFFKKNNSQKKLEELFLGILSLKGVVKQDSIIGLLEYANKKIDEDVYKLIVQLALSYPNDIGLFAPLMLNVLTLRPGEVMFIEPGMLHSYISGVSLEIMSNSDNVLRAGLTSKHIDIMELSKCAFFREKNINDIILKPIVTGGRHIYNIPTQDFKFDCFFSPDNEVIEVNCAEILLALDADAHLLHDSGEFLKIKQGESVFIPAYSKKYIINSSGRIARVYN